MIRFAYRRTKKTSVVAAPSVTLDPSRVRHTDERPRESNQR